MTKKIKELSVKTGEYTDRDGNKKSRWLNIGSLMESDDKSQFLLIESWVNLAALPRKEGQSSVLISVFDIKDKDTQTQPKANKVQEDDIPF